MDTKPSSKTRKSWDGSLSRKASLNALARVLELVARTGVTLVVNPLLVAGLGTYSFGLWQILRQFSGYLSPATGRPMQALKWTVSSKQSSRDYEDKRRDVGSAVAVWLALLPLLLVGGATMLWFVPSWLDAPPEVQPSLRRALGLIVASMALAGLVEIPRAVLTGENLGYKRMGLSAALAVVHGLLIVLALHLELGLVGVAACVPTVFLLTGLMFLLVVRRNVPWFGIARPARSAARRFFGLSMWFLSWRALMQVMRASDIVLLGFFGSVEIVTTYSLSKYLPQTVIRMVGLFVTSVAPGLGGIIGERKLDKAGKIRRELLSLTWLVLVVTGVSTLLWNRSFVGLWVGETHYAGGLSTLAIVVMVSQFAILRNDANIIDLTLDIRNKVLLGTFSALLSVAVAVVLVGPYDMGILGLCSGFLAGRMVLSVAYPWMVGRFLGIGWGSQLKSALRPIVVALVLIAAANRFRDAFVAAGWIELVLGVGTTAVFLLPLAFFGGLTGDMRAAILRRCRSVASS